MEKQYEQRIAVLAELLKQPENKECADCGARGPKWASWSIGIFLCINCAGIHRNLGTHISKVKSVTLDKWNEDQVDNMRNTGNARAKLIYEANIPSHYTRPREGASAHALESWIRAKYEKRQFIDRGRTSNYKEKREEPNRSSTSRHQKQRSTEQKPAPPSPPTPQRQTESARSMLIEPVSRAPTAQSIDLLAGVFTPSPAPAPTSTQQASQQQQTVPDLFAGLDGGQQTHQQKALDKNSIMSLYHQPIVPTMPMMSVGHQRAGPNYNVHLMPTAYVAPNGMAMVMGPTGLVPMAGYPVAASGWPAAQQQGQMVMGQPQQVGVGMNPYGFAQY